MSKEKTIYLFFEWGVIFKGFFAFIEIVGGLLAYFVSQAFILKVVLNLTQNELTEDPNDFISKYLVNSAHHLLTSTQHFIALYLLAHGLVKMVLIVGLLRNKLWAYPSSLVVFFGFVLYQLYRFTFNHSIWLLLLTLFDLIIIWFVWREYRLVKVKKADFKKL